MESLYLEEYGNGPAVVLLHGCPMSGELLAPLARSLADEFRVLVADLPGNGRSAELEHYSFERVHTLIEAALAERHISNAVLVGTSLGAYHALAIAGAGRYAVNGVVSIGGFAHLDHERRQMRGELAELVVEEDLSAPKWRELMISLMLSEQFARAHPAQAEDVAGWVERPSRSALQAELRALAQLPDLTPRLGDIRVPVTLIVGEKDVANPVADSERIRASIPHARLHVVPNAGHAVWVEQPDRVSALIREALHR